MSEQRDVTALPIRGWMLPGHVHREVSLLIDAATRTYPPAEPVTITVRRPTREEGCWCYRNGTSLEGRPHEHVPELGGCPVEPGGDNYVWFEAVPA